MPRSCWRRCCVYFTSSCIHLFWGAWPPLRSNPTICPFFLGITGQLRLWGVIPTSPPPPPSIQLLQPWRPSHASSVSVGAWGVSCSSWWCTVVGRFLQAMGGIPVMASNSLIKHLHHHQCMGGVWFLHGMFPCLFTVVGLFPRIMVGIPVQLHQLH